MLNENIKALRKSKGLSQQDLADKLNVVRQTVSKWEQRVLHFLKISAKIALVYGDSRSPDFLRRFAVI